MLNEPLWTSLSVGTYASNIRNGRTGARRLDLPLVAQGAAPVDMIKRPATADENTARPGVFNQRFFAQASLRILLSDTAADIMSLPTVTGTAPVPLGNLALTPVAGYTPGGMIAPFATSGRCAGAARHRTRAPLKLRCSADSSRSSSARRRARGRT